MSNIGRRAFVSGIAVLPVATSFGAVAMPSLTPERDRLVKRLFDKGVRNFHVSWGPEAHLCSSEELAAELNRAFDQIDREEYTPS
jgi:hypothetical protein